MPQLYRGDSSIKYAFPIVLIVVLLSGVLGALLFNTARLHGTLRQNTVDYANDVAAQLAGSISYRVQSSETYIRNLADTFAGMPEFLLTEGIENQSQVEKLCACNCDLIQGYVYAKPMEAAEFEHWSVRT